jgi:serine/threonine protein kinase
MAVSDTIPVPVPPVFATGTLVGGVYEIRALLGAGRMGQVYEAHDRDLNRRVAIKVASLGGRDALRREGQALAAVRHPCVAAVYALGVHEQIDFLVMERVYGMTLEAIIEQRRRRGEPLDLGEALDLLVSISESLAFVHAAGVVHRDVKPANVMVAPGGRVVLVDFGLMLPSVGDDDEPATSGTFEYMAPEVRHGAAGESGATDAHLLDLYALGVTAHQMLTGMLPDPEISLAAARPDAPPSLVDLVGSLMAPAPEDRPDGAEAVRDQLCAIRAHRSTAPPRSAPESAATFVLIVHPDESACELFTLYVRAALPDARVEIVSTGVDALAALRKRTPRVLFVDLDLRGVGAIEVCMYLRGLARGDLCTIAAPAGKNVGAADADVLRQLGVRTLRAGTELVSDIAALLEEIKGPSHTY